MASPEIAPAVEDKLAPDDLTIHTTLADVAYTLAKRAVRDGLRLNNTTPTNRTRTLPLPDGGTVGVRVAGPDGPIIGLSARPGWCGGTLLGEIGLAGKRYGIFNVCDAGHPQGDTMILVGPSWQTTPLVSDDEACAVSTRLAEAVIFSLQQEISDSGEV